MCILINTLPKAGSNLLVNLVLSLPGMRGADYIPTLHAPGDHVALLAAHMEDRTPGKVYTAHCPYSSEAAAWLHEAGVRVVFLRRDPRDVVVSFTHYLERDPGHEYHQPVAQLPDHNARMLAVIRGHGTMPDAPVWNAETLPGINALLEAFMGWELCAHVHALAYETLIDARTRWLALRDLAQFLGVPIVANGARGDFRAEWQPAHYEAFYQQVAGLLPQLTRRGWL